MKGPEHISALFMGSQLKEQVRAEMQSASPESWFRDIVWRKVTQYLFLIYPPRRDT